MKEEIINYIHNINEDDILNFCKKNNISISQSELGILYYYIKNKYDIFFSNPNSIFDEIRPLLSSNLYNKIIKLYNRYKMFI